VVLDHERYGILLWFFVGVGVVEALGSCWY